jgi:hypothetical protein
MAGFCLPRNHDDDSLSTTGACSTQSNANNPQIHNATYGGKPTEFEWADVFCHTKYFILPIILMVVYLCAFSIGGWKKEFNFFG